MDKERKPAIGRIFADELNSNVRLGGLVNLNISPFSFAGRDYIPLNTGDMIPLNLTPLAVGGEHVVLRSEIDRTPSFIVKVSLLEMDRPLPIEAPTHEYYERKEQLDIELHRRKGRLQKLDQHFEEHFLPEASMTRFLTFTGGEYKDIHPESDVDPEGLFSVASLIRIQSRIPELDPQTPPEQKRKSAMLALPYAERNLIDSESYALANNRWVMLEERNASFTDQDEAIINSVQQSGSLAAMLRVARSDDDLSLKEQLADFVTRAIAYSTDTREILDLRGKNNVLFMRMNNGEWDYKLIDALDPKPNPVMDNAPQALQQIAEGSDVSEQYLKNLHNGLGYVRSINALAHALGLPGRLRLFDREVTFDSSLWGDVYSQLHENTIFWRGALVTSS